MDPNKDGEISMTPKDDEEVMSENISMNQKISKAPCKNDPFKALEEQMKRDYGKYYTPCHRKVDVRVAERSPF